MAGTVNISRDIWDDPTFKSTEMSQREAWIWMIAEASWKSRVKRFGSHEVNLLRGQVAVSSRFLAKAWMWSEPRVRRYLDMLENRRMIERATDAGITVITICNYNKYQSAGCVIDAQPTQQPTHHRRTTDANYNKGEIREYIGDDGGACARDAEILPDKTEREDLLEAMGHDASGITANGRIVGNPSDMSERQRWSDLGLSHSQQIEVISEVMARKRDGPPLSFKYFTDAMRRRAADLSSPQLTPDFGGSNDNQRNRKSTRGDASSDTALRAIASAVRSRSAPGMDRS